MRGNSMNNDESDKHDDKSFDSNSIDFLRESSFNDSKDLFDVLSLLFLCTEKDKSSIIESFFD